MSNGSITTTIYNWRNSWVRDLQKHELGPTEDEDWQEYVNGLTTAELLWNLEIYDDQDFILLCVKTSGI